jgi:hypothetical protein
MKSNPLKKTLLVSTLLIASIGVGVYFARPISLLNYDDWMLEYENRKRATLTAALNDPNYWESFSQWQCFKNKPLSFHCAIADEKFKIPEVVVSDTEKEYVFGLEFAKNYDCDQILKVWKGILGSSQRFCFFGAFLPTSSRVREDGHPNPTYLISRLKGFGEWDLNDLSYELLE